MDGTLTEPRRAMERPMIDKLLSLLTVSKVGIVTGSDFDYIQEQCAGLFDEGKNLPLLFENLKLYPCNGTKVYEWKNDKKSFSKIHSSNMIDLIGQENYNRVLRQCLSYQLEIALSCDLPFSGTFLHYRESMLNWCPIGRSAEKVARESWVEKDNQAELRSLYLEKLIDFFNNQNLPLTAALGGSTSFDIYPEGWDKTYALNYVTDDRIIFIGDKCKPGGNDYTIYTALDSSDGHESYSTGSPAETITIIDKCI